MVFLLIKLYIGLDSPAAGRAFMLLIDSIQKFHVGILGDGVYVEGFHGVLAAEAVEQVVGRGCDEVCGATPLGPNLSYMAVIKVVPVAIERVLSKGCVVPETN